MKVQVVAKNSREASNYLRFEKKVFGHILPHFVEKVKVRHGDVLRADATLGEVRNVYSVLLWDQNTVESNVQYVA
jgi:hypothetical protein